jgi:hypothetical protein
MHFAAARCHATGILRRKSSVGDGVGVGSKSDPGLRLRDSEARSDSTQSGPLIFTRETIDQRARNAEYPVWHVERRRAQIHPAEIEHFCQIICHGISYRQGSQMPAPLYHPQN